MKKSFMRDKKMRSVIGKRSGLISIQALWIMVILSFLVTGLSLRALLNINIIKRSLSDTQTEFLAHSLSEIFKQEINRADSITCNYKGLAFADYERCMLSINTDTFQIQLLPGIRPKDSALAGKMDEESRINLNGAPEHVLNNLFNDPYLTGKIISIRGYLNDTSENTEGLNPAFIIMDDLLKLEDFTVSDLKRYTGFLTTFGNVQVNINTASDDILTCTGCPASLVSKLNTLKSRPGSEGHGSSGYVFFSMETLIADLIKTGFTVSTDEANYLKDMQNYRLLGVKSEYFSYNIRCNKKNTTGECVLSEIVHKPVDKPATSKQIIIWG